MTYQAILTPAYTLNATDSLGNKTTYILQNGASQVSSITRPGQSAPTTLVGYDGQGRVTSIFNGVTSAKSVGKGAGTWTYSYRDNFPNSGQRTTISTDPLGHTRTVVSSLSTSLVATDTDGLGRTRSFTYDGSGRLTFDKRPLGDQTQYVYDGRGNVIQVIGIPVPSSGLSDTYITSNYDSACNQPSKCNKPNWIKDQRGWVTNFTYSPGAGQLTQVDPPTPGSVQPETRFSYTPLFAWYKNSSGQIVQASGSVTLLAGVSTCATNAPATCVGTTDETKTTLAYFAGSSGTATNLGVKSLTVASGTGTPTSTSSQTFDSYGNVASTTGPLGSAQTTNLLYDLNRNLIGAIGPQLPDAKYPAVSVTYNGSNQQTQIARGTTTSATSLASFVNLEQQNLAYDALGRLSQTSQASGSTTNALSQYTYDNANNLVCTAVRMNPSTFASPPASACIAATAGANGPDRITVNTYDKANELTKTTLAYLTTVQQDYATLTWTDDGYVNSVLDAAQNLTTFIYDGLSRLSKVEFPSPTTKNQSNVDDLESYGYDAHSNLTGITTRDGDIITANYDALNRVYSKTFSEDASQNVNICYDLLNRTTGVSHAGCGAQVQFGWDALSRLTSETRGGRTISYGYDAAGDRTGATWPDASPHALSAIYGYDWLQRVTSITANSAPVATYAYDDLGRRWTITRNGGSAAGTTYGWDGADRIQSLAHALSGSGAVTLTLAYDAANELLTDQVSNSGYVYNPAASSVAYTADGLNRYPTIGGQATQYDLGLFPGRGNLTTEPTTGRNFTYDLEDRLLSASAPTAVTLTYDATGTLASSTASGAATNFLYSGSDLVGEYDGSGNILRRYVPGPGVDEPAIKYEGSGESNAAWIIADQQGSVMTWSTASGSAGSSYSYDPFGNPNGAAFWTGLRFRFTGQIMIPEAQLYHFKARAYAPNIGRFLQTDPLRFGGGDTNFYAYVGNDPISRVDFWGLDATSCDFVVCLGEGPPTDVSELIITGRRCSGLLHRIVCFTADVLQSIFGNNGINASPTSGFVGGTTTTTCSSGSSRQYGVSGGGSALLVFVGGAASAGAGVSVPTNGGPWQGFLSGEVDLPLLGPA